MKDGSESPKMQWMESNKTNQKNILLVISIL